MGAWEDDLAKKQVDNEVRTGKKNYAAPRDTSKIQPQASPEATQANKSAGSFPVEFDKGLGVMERNLQKKKATIGSPE